MGSGDLTLAAPHSSLWFRCVMCVHACLIVFALYFCWLWSFVLVFCSLLFNCPTIVESAIVVVVVQSLVPIIRSWFHLYHLLHCCCLCSVSQVSIVEHVFFCCFCPFIFITLGHIWFSCVLRYSLCSKLQHSTPPLQITHKNISKTTRQPDYIHLNGRNYVYYSIFSHHLYLNTLTINEGLWFMLKMYKNRNNSIQLPKKNWNLKSSISETKTQIIYMYSEYISTYTK